MLKLQYFGHLMRRTDSFEKTLMLGKEEKETTEDEMVGWHRWLNGQEFEQAPGVGNGQKAWRAAVHGSQTIGHDLVTELIIGPGKSYFVHCFFLWTTVYSICPWAYMSLYCYVLSHFTFCHTETSDKTGMGEFNSDVPYIYYCGQESLRRNGVAIIVNKRLWNAVFGCNPKNDRKISVHFQGQTIQYHGNPSLCPDQ